MTNVGQITPQRAAEILRAAQIPKEILEVTGTLQNAGFVAVLVGGAVRDCLRGHPQSDWDVASSARPEEVQSLFRRTIPTGIQHGTVTVLSGSGDDRHAIEVTTFRGEGEYHDGRRPSSVEYLRDLEGDLARRDFTINAFAWDPHSEVFTDVFCGLQDLNAGVVRAVGSALGRFREDGLRIMRAVRFCATLDCNLHDETFAAISGAFDVFKQVSGERVRVELHKLLESKTAANGLQPMWKSGLWELVVPSPQPGSFEDVVSFVCSLPAHFTLRTAALLRPAALNPDELNQWADRLKLSKNERRVIADLCSDAVSLIAAGKETPATVRRLLASVKHTSLDDILLVGGADEQASALARSACENAALTPKQLAIKGGELIKDGLIQPGPPLGELMANLFEYVLEHPSKNTKEELLREAKRLLEPTVPQGEGVE